MLEGKHIILGLSGGIAAYKSAYLVRALVNEGAEVKVIMTENAKRFISTLTMSTLSKNPVYTEFFEPTSGEWHSHVKLGIWADLMIIAPATANTLAKMASGIADNLLTTTCLSARCPVMAAPAMDLDMYSHPATQANFETLKSRGVMFVEAESGFLASGLQGKGRMAEPEHIMDAVRAFFDKKGSLSGKKIMVTAGPTYEKIDPVRFIGNYSTGKMGYAIAEECASRGAEVTIVSGPVSIGTRHPGINVIRVESAAQMAEAAKSAFEHADIGILSAAVADFTPDKTVEHKIKREHDGLHLILKPTTDIAASLGAMKKEGQILAGFALETDNEVANAQSKMHRKNFDFIVLNSLNDKGAGFGYDTNKVCIISRDGTKRDYPLKSKQEVAKDIMDCITTA